MKIFNVINEALHHDSSYHQVTPFATRQEAEGFIKKELKKFLMDVEFHQFGEDFNEWETNPDLVMKGYDEIRQSTKGYYEAWKIEEHTVRAPWRFLPEKKTDDNFHGVLTNGEECLFWMKTLTKEGKQYRHIFYKMDMSYDSEECRYEWTPENDFLVLNALNHINDSNDCVLPRLSFNENLPLAEINTLVSDLETIFSAIAEEAGANMTYSESMDGSLLNAPLEILQGNTEEELFDGCRFLAENNNLFPNDYKSASNEEIKAYAISHAKDIIREIRHTAECDYTSRFGKNFFN